MSELIREALSLVIDIARQSQECRLVELPGARVALVRGDSVQILDHDRKKRCEEVATLQSFCRWLMAVGTDRDVQVVVFADRVIAEVDLESHLKDECSMPIRPSAAMEALTAWMEKPLSVQDVVRLLRTALADTYDSRHLATFKRVDFQRFKTASQKVSHAGESLGRAVEKLAQSADGEIPEVLTFELNLSNLDVPFGKAKLQFAVEVNCDSERVAIHPIGDCVAEARASLKQALLAWLDGQLPEKWIVLAGDDE